MSKLAFSDRLQCWLWEYDHVLLHKSLLLRALSCLTHIRNHHWCSLDDHLLGDYTLCGYLIHHVTKGHI